jgi:translation elongation factor EF-Tu-like GTPase
MRSVYNRVRAKVYFLQPEEGGRSRNVDLLHSRTSYVLLADLGLGYTEDGFPIRCWARVELEGGPGYIELGVEQTVQVELQCGEGAAVEPGVSFELSEGAKVVARATVLSVLETVVE